VQPGPIDTDTNPASGEWAIPQKAFTALDRYGVFCASSYEMLCFSITLINNLAPHDLRRTCARLCHLAGGELEQIQFLLGHASVETLSAIWAASRTSTTP